MFYKIFDLIPKVINFMSLFVGYGDKDPHSKDKLSNVAEFRRSVIRDSMSGQEGPPVRYVRTRRTTYKKSGKYDQLATLFPVRDFFKRHKSLPCCK
jgi:hypothetical protein